MVKKIIAKHHEVGVLNKSNVSYEITPDPSAISKPGMVSGHSGTLNIDSFNDEDGLTHKQYKISQWGSDNLFPNNLKKLFSNNIIPGLFDFKQDMFFGQGPELFTVDKTGKKIISRDGEITSWLKSWDHISFLIDIFADAAAQENMFVQFRRNKAKNKIADLIFIDADECRLEVKGKNNKSSHIFVNNWEESSNDQIKVYPVFNPRDPVADPISMIHLSKKSSTYKYYALPVYVGLINYWLPLANEIPKFHLSRLQRSLNIKYHLKIPVQSLEYIKETRRFTQDQLNAWLKKKLETLDKMLSGAHNAGKIFYSYLERDSNGKEMAGWEINLIDNNEKEMSEANLSLYNESNQAITSAMQVQPSLACIQLGQKMSSGSEILNAYNLHIKTRTPIIRHLALKPINAAIQHNWPNKNAFVEIVDPLLVKQEVDKSGVFDPNNAV